LYLLGKHFTLLGNHSRRQSVSVLKSTIFFAVTPVVWYEFTDVSEELAAFIFRVEE
jgi:hypothetical protein